MRLIPRTAPVIALVAVVALLAASGGAVAASLITSARIQDNTIRSRDVRNGTLKLADISSAAQSALQGPGSPWAMVNAAGTLVYNGGAVSSTLNSTGVYTVTFDHDVSFCGSLAVSIDNPAIMSTATGPRYGGPGTDIRVYVEDAAGLATNTGLAVAVFC